MEILKVENFSFKYPGEGPWILNNVDFSLKEGEFVLLTGLSASGKTTLLRQCKKPLAAFGDKKGRIFFQGKELAQLSLREDAQGIGFVQQDPQNQIVTDKVWHELAFGLESLGLDQETMRLRVGEIASFFGMEPWFLKKVRDLSGGQLQMVNLASILCMQPKLLLLDEPTAMLDPIASLEFFQGLNRVCQELGITVLVSEHRLTEPYALAKRILFLQDGKIAFDGDPRSFAQEMKSNPQAILESLPSPVQIYAKSSWTDQVPLTVGEALRSRPEIERRDLEAQDREDFVDGPSLLSMEKIYFRYQKEGQDVLKGVNFDLKKGEIHAILGGNGAGKSSLLKVIAGVEEAHRGKIFHEGVRRKPGTRPEDLALVPQHPKALFVYKRAREELEEMTQDQEALKKVIEDFDLGKILDHHPFDLSGGEMERLALAKIFLKRPKILLLDEPTKGMDGDFKLKFKGLLRDYLQEGGSVLMVSHDVEFCAETAHRCSLFFNGECISQGSRREFFSGNHFYTTAANKIFRKENPNILTVEDAVKAINFDQERKRK